MGGLFQINPVTKTGQRLYMVRNLSQSEYLMIIIMPGPHAPTPLPAHHSPNHSEQVSSQVSVLLESTS